MNVLKFYPKPLRKIYLKNIKQAGIETNPNQYVTKQTIIAAVLAVFSTLFLYLFDVSTFYFILVFFLLEIFFYFQLNLKAIARLKKMETVFPDTISLMASNLRSGITIDRSFLLAARPEFAPLDREILEAGKEISTGKDTISAMKAMSQRIGSEKISKVILLIISGLRAGGNIADLLEQTSQNMKEKEILEKKTASTTLMYVIFIFFAVSVGAPVLFGLSSVLVEVIMGLASKMPDVGAAQGASSAISFTFNEITLSLNFVIWFSIIFITVTDFISCFVIGLVNKGNAKSGLKLFLPMLILSITLFVIIRSILSGLLLGLMSF